jgi:hypothetical protein
MWISMPDNPLNLQTIVEALKDSRPIACIYDASIDMEPFFAALRSIYRSLGGDDLLIVTRESGHPDLRVVVLQPHDAPPPDDLFPPHRESDNAR